MSTHAYPAARPAPVPDSDDSIGARFQWLVQSPLRAALLRCLAGAPQQAFDLDSLMQRVGHLRTDVDNCLRQLENFGLVRRLGGGRPQFVYVTPAEPIRTLIDDFRSAGKSTAEERSASVQRFRELIGQDEKMVVIFESIRMAAKSDVAVLVLGPTGSGKEVVARMIHDLSRRSKENLQAVNCAAVPDALFESEIFGYEKGAFTGAHARKIGRLELANRGTLFLDEIGDLSLVAQAKLLRVLEDRRFERLGGNQSIEVNFRLISATNRPLDQFVADEKFREDLYYRINAFSVRLPSLRERASDIPLLAERFLARYCAANGLPPDAKSFAEDAHAALRAYHWPGNIRELESTVSRAALSSRDRVIRAADIQFLHARPAAERVPAEPGRLASLAEVERDHLAHVLDALGWNKRHAARVLGVSRGTLYRKIVEHGLQENSPETPTQPSPPARNWPRSAIRLTG